MIIKKRSGEVNEVRVPAPTNETLESIRRLVGPDVERMWRQADDLRRQIENNSAVLGLGRSTAFIESLMKSDMASLGGLTPRISQEYEAMLAGLDSLADPSGARRSLEEFWEQQMKTLEERSRRDAELTGIGMDLLTRRLAEERESLASTLALQLDRAEQRRKLLAESSWPSLGRAPLSAEKAELTDQLFGRNAFETHCESTKSFADAHDLPVSFLIVDVDHFKAVNDDFGHPTGDRFLLKVAECLRSVVGAKGRAYRYGGEEFAALLPNCDSDEAFALGERLRRGVSQAKIDEVTRPVTISVGLSTYPDPATDFPELLKQADDALYASKHGGRNRVTRFERHPS